MSGGLCVTVEAMGCQWSLSYRGGHGMSGGLCVTVEAMGCQWSMSYRGGHEPGKESLGDEGSGGAHAHGVLP